MTKEQWLIELAERDFKRAHRQALRAADQLRLRLQTYEKAVATARETAELLAGCALTEWDGEHIQEYLRLYLIEESKRDSSIIVVHAYHSCIDVHQPVWKKDALFTCPECGTPWIAQRNPHGGPGKVVPACIWMSGRTQYHPYMKPRGTAHMQYVERMKQKQKESV